MYIDSRSSWTTILPMSRVNFVTCKHDTLWFITSSLNFHFIFSTSAKKRLEEFRVSTSLSNPCRDTVSRTRKTRRRLMQRICNSSLILSYACSLRAQIMRVTRESRHHARASRGPSSSRSTRDNDVNSAKEITRRNLGRPFGRLQYRNGETV